MLRGCLFAGSARKPELHSTRAPAGGRPGLPSSAAGGRGKIAKCFHCGWPLLGAARLLGRSARLLCTKSLPSAGGSCSCTKALVQPPCICGEPRCLAGAGAVSLSPSLERACCTGCPGWAVPHVGARGACCLWEPPGSLVLSGFRSRGGRLSRFHLGRAVDFPL